MLKDVSSGPRRRSKGVERKCDVSEGGERDELAGYLAGFRCLVVDEAEKVRGHGEDGEK